MDGADSPTPNVSAAESIAASNVLPTIDAPQEAIAETNQRTCFSRMVPPRGVEARFHVSTPTTMIVPHPQSAFWFRELYDGYMCAQTVSTPKFATDVLKFITAENLELELAKKDPTLSIDESLPPRTCSIWLLGNYANACSPAIDNVLDALALWANFKPHGTDRVVNKVRMSAAFGQDANFVLQTFNTEIVGDLTTNLCSQQIMIVLRWHNGFSVQTVTRDVSQFPGLSNPHHAIRCLQDTVVRLAGTYDAPLPSVCMKAILHEMDTHQFFYKCLHDVSNQFFDLLVGKPSITFSDFTRAKNASRILQHTGHLVRVVNKNLGKDGMLSPTCFHGAVVGLSYKRKEINAFIDSNRDENGLQVPQHSNVELGLHLCAVQAEGLKLKTLVSLFGTMGVAGKPIHSPGSWVWIASPAVRPIQADLLQVFELHPCHVSSLIPGRAELVPGFERFWARTTDLYKMIANGETTMSNLDSEKNVNRSSSPTSVRELQFSDQDLAMLTLMQIDMKSERTTIGDAYAALSPISSAGAIAQNMLEVMGSRGVRASLYDLWKYNCQASHHFRQHDDAKRKSDQCLMDLCEIALDMACDRKRTRNDDDQTPICVTAERMRRILKACSLKAGIHVSINRGSIFSQEQESAVFDIVVSSIWAASTPDPNVATLIKRPFVKLMKENIGLSPDAWVQNVHQSFASSASVATVALGAVNTATFFVVGTRVENEVLIKRINLNGSIEASSMDALCQVRDPKVIILQELEMSQKVSNVKGAYQFDDNRTCWLETLDDDVALLIMMSMKMKECARLARACKRFKSMFKQCIGSNMNLVGEQVDCFLDAMLGKNVFITGAAGCGKSHVLKTIIKHLPEEGLAVTASTGCAAAIIGAATFHSTCGLGLGKAPAKVIAKRIMEENPYAYQRLRKLKTLVVDEAGMLTGRLFDKAGDVVGMVNRAYGKDYQSVMSNAQPTYPFGDVQVILCGDALQLPPVGVEEEGWIFESRCWKMLGLKTHLLTHVHRQQDTKFIEILKRMRVGASTHSDLNHLIGNSAQVQCEHALKLFAVNAPANDENHNNLVKLPGPFHPFAAIDSANDPNVKEAYLQEMLKHCPAPKMLFIKEKARVMCLKNVDHRLVNGSLGTVKRVFPMYNSVNSLVQVGVTVEFDGNLGEDGFAHTFYTHRLGEQVDPANHFTIRGQNNKKLAQRIQLPLRLAWAVSIHKSQGMSLSNVSIDFLKTFSPGQAYTALSRVKTLAGAHLKGLKLSHMHMVHSKPIQFYRSL